jgi:hypothetical protein
MPDAARVRSAMMTRLANPGSHPARPGVPAPGPASSVPAPIIIWVLIGVVGREYSNRRANSLTIPGSCRKRWFAAQLERIGRSGPDRGSGWFAWQELQTRSGARAIIAGG